MFKRQNYYQLCATADNTSRIASWKFKYICTSSMPNCLLCSLYGISSINAVYSATDLNNSVWYEIKTYKFQQLLCIKKVLFSIKNQFEAQLNYNVQNGNALHFLNGMYALCSAWLYFCWQFSM